MAERKLKVGDVISYEPRPEWPEAQKMWGCLGVVRELVGEHVDEPTVRVHWTHHLPPGTDDQWVNMRITEGNCRKIGEVSSPEEVPDAV
jgi:hypothetical protein